VNEWEWQLLEDKHPLDHLEIAGIEVRAGDRVRLRPRKGGDVLDIALAGQTATIEALEQDYEGKSHVCVVLDEDPGRDMGMRVGSDVGIHTQGHARPNSVALRQQLRDLDVQRRRLG